MPPMYSRLFPSIKDYTECQGVIAALWRRLKIYYPVHYDVQANKLLSDLQGNPRVVCYVLGDGRLAQGAALLALLSPVWTIHSIDPALSRRSQKHKLLPPNVHLHACRGKDSFLLLFFSSLEWAHILPTAEDFQQIDQRASLSIVLAIHSHANLNDFWERIILMAPTQCRRQQSCNKARRSLKKIAVALPCCFEQSIQDLAPVETFRDLGILSFANGIAIWEKMG